MSQFLHNNNNDAKAIAIPQVFTKAAELKMSAMKANIKLSNCLTISRINSIITLN